MTFEYRFINKQVFENSVSYTLLISAFDENDNETEYRIDKTFKVQDIQIDEEFLRTEAKKEITKIKEALVNSIQELPEEIIWSPEPPDDLSVYQESGD